MRIDAHIPRPRKPVDVAPDGYEADWCTCGQRIWGTDRRDFAANWYGHLLKMLDVDPDGDHALPGRAR